MRLRGFMRRKKLSIKEFIWRPGEWVPTGIFEEGEKIDKQIEAPDDPVHFIKITIPQGKFYLEVERNINPKLGKYLLRPADLDAVPEDMK